MSPHPPDPALPELFADVAALVTRLAPLQEELETLPALAESVPATRAKITDLEHYEIAASYFDKVVVLFEPIDDLVEELEGFVADVAAFREAFGEFHAHVEAHPDVVTAVELLRQLRPVARLNRTPPLLKELHEAIQAGNENTATECFNLLRPEAPDAPLAEWLAALVDAATQLETTLDEDVGSGCHALIARLQTLLGETLDPVSAAIPSTRTPTFYQLGKHSVASGSSFTPEWILGLAPTISPQLVSEMPGSGDAAKEAALEAARELLEAINAELRELFKFAGRLEALLEGPMTEIIATCATIQTRLCKVLAYHDGVPAPADVPRWHEQLAQYVAFAKGEAASVAVPEESLELDPAAAIEEGATLAFFRTREASFGGTAASDGAESSDGVESSDGDGGGAGTTGDGHPLAGVAASLSRVNYAGSEDLDGTEAFVTETPGRTTLASLNLPSARRVPHVTRTHFDERGLVLQQETIVDLAEPVTVGEVTLSAGRHLALRVTRAWDGPFRVTEETTTFDHAGEELSRTCKVYDPETGVTTEVPPDEETNVLGVPPDADINALYFGFPLFHALLPALEVGLEQTGEIPLTRTFEDDSNPALRRREEVEATCTYTVKVPRLTRASTPLGVLPVYEVTVEAQSSKTTTTTNENKMMPQFSPPPIVTRQEATNVLTLHVLDVRPRVVVKQRSSWRFVTTVEAPMAPPPTVVAEMATQELVHATGVTLPYRET